MDYLEKYFYDRPVKINNYAIRKLNIIKEIKILNLWNTLEKAIIDDVSGIKSIRILNTICKMAIKTKVELKPDNIKKLYMYLKTNVIDHIGFVLKDKNVESYFNSISQNEYTENLAEREFNKLLGYIDYIGFCSETYGVEGLKYFNINQLHILKRYHRIKTIRERISLFYDNLSATHPSQGSVERYINNLESDLKIRTGTGFNDNIAEIMRIKEEKRKNNPILKLSEEEFVKLQDKEFQEFLNGSNN